MFKDVVEERISPENVYITKVITYILLVNDDHDEVMK